MGYDVCVDGCQQGVCAFLENFMHEISGTPGAEFLQQIGPMEVDGTAG
jgi:hypothetical protein